MEAAKINSVIYPLPPSCTNTLEEFPFDDDMLRGHLSVRSHLEDLAKRHPDLAGHLRCPPWGGEPSTRGWSRKRTVSGEDNKSEEPSDLNHNHTDTLTESSPDKKPFEENMDKEQQPPFENNSRSQENDDKPQRFVSKLEFTPVNLTNQSENVQQSAQPQSEHSQPKEPHNDTSTFSQGNQKQPNVRHIPIYVEGRSEPVYPKNVDQIFSENNGSALPKRASGKQTPFAQYHSFHDQNTAQRRQTPPSQQRQQTPPQHQHIPPNETRSTPPPPPRQQVKPVDALEKVQNVQAEVEELAVTVNKFSGSSRTDKQYIYLDEMLTRNLIKLDTIETEGRDDVRMARKKAIKTIQDTISILENKVPQPQEESMEVDQSTDDVTEVAPSEDKSSETEKVENNN
ncbi:BAG domain-containing protein Samui isoform X2 [Sipha flava]|uniref:BAG domain-containing protein Samui isoform X2 n=1 Tax=Sipha flava TaxID=143950 RepID=A0A8B8FUB0_9HEMI|nr:BAG domain-containing protein Samui isoform X2 [Sipha flava]XP_025414007.1 BAG domain-containing protein Samui isoform X2 [Sipha flava]